MLKNQIIGGAPKAMGQSTIPFFQSLFSQEDKIPKKTKFKYQYEYLLYK